MAARSARLPKSLLYSIFARIGGWGLDTDAFETLRASYHGGFLGKAIAYDNRQNEIPASKIRSLRWHPVRLPTGSRERLQPTTPTEILDVLPPKAARW